jgi:hypothetical protein
MIYNEQANAILLTWGPIIATYPDLQLYIGGKWKSADGQPVVNPADKIGLGRTGERKAKVPKTSPLFAGACITRSRRAWCIQ